MADITLHEGDLNAEGKRFALVASRYNEIVSRRLVSGAQDCLQRHGAADEDIELYRVPGSFEIPLVAGIPAPEGLPPLTVLEPPRVDLERLADLQPTLALLRRTGVL